MIHHFLGVHPSKIEVFTEIGRHEPTDWPKRLPGFGGSKPS
jgi:hypothetical protein